MPEDVYDLLDLMAMAGCAAVVSWIIFGVFYW